MRHQVRLTVSLGRQILAGQLAFILTLLLRKDNHEVSIAAEVIVHSGELFACQICNELFFNFFTASHVKVRSIVLPVACKLGSYLFKSIRSLVHVGVSSSHKKWNGEVEERDTLHLRECCGLVRVHRQIPRHSNRCSLTSSIAYTRAVKSRA